VKEGWLDYIVPQLYWYIGFDVADYAKLLPWWSSLVEGTKVQLYIGQADYRVGEKGPWGHPNQLDLQLALNSRYSVSGSIHFSARQVRDDKLGAATRYRRAHYATPALVPEMRQLPGIRPFPPKLSAATRDSDGAVTLAWTPQGDAATRHAVYRVDLAANDPPRLVGTVTGGTSRVNWTDRTAAADRAYAYCVTGLDRLWNEGPASMAEVVSKA
jgi:hypothetical protein